jgi:hypothetical protein
MIDGTAGLHPLNVKPDLVGLTGEVTDVPDSWVMFGTVLPPLLSNIIVYSVGAGAASTEKLTVYVFVTVPSVDVTTTDAVPGKLPAFVTLTPAPATLAEALTVGGIVVPTGNETEYDVTPELKAGVSEPALVVKLLSVASAAGTIGGITTPVPLTVTMPVDESYSKLFAGF